MLKNNNHYNLTYRSLHFHVDCPSWPAELIWSTTTLANNSGIWVAIERRCSHLALQFFYVIWWHFFNIIRWKIMLNFVSIISFPPDKLREAQVNSFQNIKFSYKHHTICPQTWFSKKSWDQSKQHYHEISIHAILKLIYVFYRSRML